jgi:sugar/nucleoside kinase (ribokinase family)
MFVVSGEALMDVFAVGDTPTGVQLDARIGGSPFNVAVGLARLGQSVALLAGLSSGFLGQRLMRALQDEGVLTDCVMTLDAPTTLSLIGLDDRGVPSYSFYGQGAADRSLPLSAHSLLPSSARAFHFGSYAMVVDPVAMTLRALVERECERSADFVRPERQAQCRAPVGAVARGAAVDVASDPPAEDQRRRPRADRPRARARRLRVGGDSLAAPRPWW